MTLIFEETESPLYKDPLEALAIHSNPRYCSSEFAQLVVVQIEDGSTSSPAEDVQPDPVPLLKTVVKSDPY